MNSKILVLSIAVIAVGLFAMPGTLSLFAGQHTFTTGANVNCAKCHQDIYDELNSASNGVHTSSQLKRCEGCHRTGNVTTIPIQKNANGSYDYSGYKNQSLGSVGAHAAVTMECVGCHTGVPAELLDSDEAHGPFYNAANGTKNVYAGNTSFLKGSNEACVGCHTHINVNATWRRSVGMDFIVNESTTGAYSITISVNNSFNTTTTRSNNITADGQFS